MGATLRYGSRGPDVRHLQRLLNKCLRPSPNLPGNDRFGPRTEAAVRLYQATLGLPPTGVAGPSIWAALGKNMVTHHAITTSTPVDFSNAPWMMFAKQELGQSEVPGSQHNPKIIEYHAATSLRASTDETPWCSSFVNWCLQKAGIVGTKSAAAMSWIHWGKQSAAIPGAITIIHNIKAIGSSLSASGYHVGFLIQDMTSHYQLLGGNQKNQVKVSLLPKASWRFVGYRWPKR